MKLIQANTFSTLVLSLCVAAASTNEEDSSSSGIHVLGFRIPSPKRILTILHFEWEEEAPAVELVVPVESIDEEKLAEVLEEELKLIEKELELVETIDDEKRARAFEEELLPQVDPQEDVSLLIKNTTIAKLPKISHTSSRTSMKPAMTPEKKSNTNTKAKYKKKTTVYKKSGISKKNEAAASTIEKVKANRKKTKQKSQDGATSKLDGNSQHDEGGKLRKKKKKTAKAAAKKTWKTPKYVKGMKRERALVDAVADDFEQNEIIYDAADDNAETKLTNPASYPSDSRYAKRGRSYPSPSYSYGSHSYPSYSSKSSKSYSYSYGSYSHPSSYSYGRSYPSPSYPSGPSYSYGSYGRHSYGSKSSKSSKSYGYYSYGSHRSYGSYPSRPSSPSSPSSPSGPSPTPPTIDRRPTIEYYSGFVPVDRVDPADGANVYYNGNGNGFSNDPGVGIGDGYYNGGGGGGGVYYPENGAGNGGGVGNTYYGTDGGLTGDTPYYTGDVVPGLENPYYKVEDDGDIGDNGDDKYIYSPSDSTDIIGSGIGIEEPKVTVPNTDTYPSQIPPARTPINYYADENNDDYDGSYRSADRSAPKIGEVIGRPIPKNAVPKNDGYNSGKRPLTKYPTPKRGHYYHINIDKKLPKEMKNPSPKYQAAPKRDNYKSPSLLTPTLSKQVGGPSPKDAAAPKRDNYGNASFSRPGDTADNSLPKRIGGPSPKVPVAPKRDNHFRASFSRPDDLPKQVGGTSPQGPTPKGTPVPPKESTPKGTPVSKRIAKQPRAQVAMTNINEEKMYLRNQDSMDGYGSDDFI